MSLRPAVTARVSSAFWFLYCAGASEAMSARRPLIVRADAALTAANILAHPSRLQLSFAADVLSMVFDAVFVVLLYRLFKPVSETGALMATVLSLMGCVIQSASVLFQLAPLNILRADPNQKRLALAILELFPQTYSSALVFFGFFGILLGWLILRSTFLPRFLGVLWIAGGFIWLIFLSPELGERFLRYVMFAGLGEGVFILWLLLAGLNEEKWFALHRA